MIRGYSIKQQLHFMEQCEPEALRRWLATVPPDVKSTLDNLKAAEWYPRKYSVGILRAIAAHHGSDERATYDAMVHCGTFIAEEATNTFLKLLMKVLTPALFAKKIPEFWKRDHTRGRFEVNTAGAKTGSLEFELQDVEGFDHIGVVGIGWMTFGFNAMGKSDVVVTQTGWSLATPGPANVRYRVRWS